MDKIEFLFKLKYYKKKMRVKMGNDNLKKPKGIPEENIYLTLHWSIILVVILSCVFLYMLIFQG